jgi:hypothetical protein
MPKAILNDVKFIFLPGASQFRIPAIAQAAR